jgi:hypothetical protein
VLAPELLAGERAALAGWCGWPAQAQCGHRDPSMRTHGGKVVRGRWGRSATGRSLSGPLAADDVAVFGCCVRLQARLGPALPLSGLRITMQDWLRWPPCLLSVLRCTSIDAGVRGCMRLGMRLPRSIHPPLRSSISVCTVQRGRATADLRQMRRGPGRVRQAPDRRSAASGLTCMPRSQ